MDWLIYVITHSGYWENTKIYCKSHAYKGEGFRNFLVLFPYPTLVIVLLNQQKQGLLILLNRLKMFQFSMVLYTIGFFEQLGHVKFLNFFSKLVLDQFLFNYPTLVIVLLNQQKQGLLILLDKLKMFQFSMVLYTIGFFWTIRVHEVSQFFFTISTRPILSCLFPKITNVGFTLV